MHNVQLSVKKDADDEWWVTESVDGQIAVGTVGPFDTKIEAERALTDAVRMLASVNN